MAQHSFADSIRQEAGHTPEANLAWLRRSQRKYRRGEAWSVILIAALIALFAVAALTGQLDPPVPAHRRQAARRRGATPPAHARLTGHGKRPGRQLV